VWADVPRCWAGQSEKFSEFCLKKVRISSKTQSQIGLELKNRQLGDFLVE